MTHKIKKINKPLHVISVVSNPVRFRTRYSLYLEFEQRMLRNENVVLHTVEVAHGDREHEVTNSSCPQHYQHSTHDELWIKENMINLGLRELPSDAEYVAWIDADVDFVRPDWAEETIHQLQHYKVVQMFSHAIDLGPEYEKHQDHTGYIYQWLNNPELRSTPKYGPHGLKYHPGFAWAAKVDTVSKLGGLIDWAILGAGDTHMAGSFTGVVDKTFAPGMTEGYKASLLRWQDRCEKVVDRNVGYVPGTLHHYWHGKKKDRGYWDRWKILSNNQYDPHVDIVRDHKGVIHLADNKRDLRDGIMAYFRSRNEDSIDV